MNCIWFCAWLALSLIAEGSALSFSVDSAQHVFLRDIDLTKALENDASNNLFLKEFWSAPLAFYQGESMVENMTTLSFRVFGGGISVGDYVPSYRAEFLSVENGTRLFASPWTSTTYSDCIEFEFNVDDAWMSGTYQLRLMHFAHEVPHWPANDTLPLNTIDFSAIPVFERRIFVTEGQIRPSLAVPDAEHLCLSEGDETFMPLLCVDGRDSAAKRVANFSLSPSFPARWVNHYDDSLVFSPRKTQLLAPFASAATTILEGTIVTYRGITRLPVLTGCDSYGRSSTPNCRNWRSKVDRYIAGFSSTFTTNWIYYYTSRDCASPSYVYCISKLSVEERIHSQLEAILDGQMLPYTVLLP